ncbi:hypothetical protein BDF19DRAFT_419505 [Syncephalis fuscata]|nr:hypothetical protein BDF19DRAFT_419505 [Syncephalis fuscata]
MPPRRTRRGTAKRVVNKRSAVRSNSNNSSSNSNATLVHLSTATTSASAENTSDNTTITTIEETELQRKYKAELALRCTALEQRTEALIHSLQMDYETRLAAMPMEIRQMPVRVFCEEYEGSVALYLARIAQSTASTSSTPPTTSTTTATPSFMTAKNRLSYSNSNKGAITTNEETLFTKDRSTRSTRPTRIPRSARKRTMTRSRTALMADSQPPPPSIHSQHGTAMMTTPKLDTRLPKTPLITNQTTNQAHNAMKTPLAHVKSTRMGKRLTLRRQPSLVSLASPETVITLPLGKGNVLELDPAISPSNVRHLGDTERQQVKEKLAKMQSQLARLMQSID